MRMVDLIARKRDGDELTTAEINDFIRGYTADAIPDYQAAALLMAIYLRGMNRRETVDLTLAMAHSGDMLDLRAVVAATGYKGSDAIADHVLAIVQVGADAVLSIDPDGSGGQAAHKVVTLEHVTASSLHAGHDFLWH